jgi:hypothetical protein
MIPRFTPEGILSRLIATGLALSRRRLQCGIHIENFDLVALEHNSAVSVPTVNRTIPIPAFVYCGGLRLDLTMRWPCR